MAAPGMADLAWIDIHKNRHWRCLALELFAHPSPHHSGTPNDDRIPAGQFYRFNLAGSLLRAAKPAWEKE